MTMIEETSAQAVTAKRRSVYDFYILVTVILLSLYGCLIIYSATGFGNIAMSVDPFYFLRRQLIFFITGMIIFVILSFFDYYKIKRYWIPLYLINIAILIIVLFLGESIHSSTSWLGWGIFKLQPSEFAKIWIILSYAAFLSERKGQVSTFKDFFYSILLFGIPIFLIMLQPDLGTASVYIGILIGMMFVAEVRFLFIGIAAVLGTTSIFLVLRFGLIKDYIIKRFIVFLNPNVDPFGAGYNLTQSKIAIGSGQILGKGLFLGTQTNLNYIPEHHTDFVFSVLGEELGLVGAAVLLVLYMILVWRCFHVARKSKDLFGVYICVGVASLLICQSFVNIGMTIGLMPITGIPLPFI
ncbi:MAG: rod shape-determining protein RodA, partial [Omnitrophica WOR_2 bacterium RBG_13_44_8]